MPKKCVSGQGMSVNLCGSQSAALFRGVQRTSAPSGAGKPARLCRDGRVAALHRFGGGSTSRRRNSGQPQADRSPAPEGCAIQMRTKKDRMLRAGAYDPISITVSRRFCLPLTEPRHRARKRCRRRCPAYRGRDRTPRKARCNCPPARSRRRGTQECDPRCGWWKGGAQ